MRLSILVISIFVPLLSIAVGLEDGADAYRLRTVVIDAGHGGHDPGTSGSASKEKDIALKIALKLGGYIESYFPSVRVIYTRKTDVFVELHERAKIANENKADLFISIHCNAVPNASGTYGTETFVMGQHKLNANLNVAKRENDVILMEKDFEEHYDGFDPNSPEAHIIFSLYQNAYQDQSIALASNVQEEFALRAKRKSRGVKQAGFLVLYKTTMPSILIETGFLTNSKEQDYLNGESGQDYIASAIYRAFKKYKKDVEHVLGPDETETLIASNAAGPMTKKIEEPETNVAPEGLGEQEPVEPIDSKTAEEIARELGIEFRIQIGIFSKDFDPADPKFKDLEQIKTEAYNESFKYMVVGGPSMQKAIELQMTLKERFEGCFLVVYKGNERIPLKEAMQLIKE